MSSNPVTRPPLGSSELDELVLGPLAAALTFGIGRLIGVTVS